MQDQISERAGRLEVKSIDNKLAAGDLGNLPRQFITTVMAAEKRHYGAAVSGQSNDGGLPPFVIEDAGESTNDDPSGTDSDDGLSIAEQSLQFCRGFLVRMIQAFDAAGAVDLAAQCRLELERQGQSGASENKKGRRLHHASPPL